MGTKRPRDNAGDASKVNEIDTAWFLHNAHMLEIRRVWLERHLAKQQGKCAYCSVLISTSPLPGREDQRATIDHVVARSQGGEDVEDNTVAACAACNSAKADMAEREFESHPIRLQRLRAANTPPDRLAADPLSAFYNDEALMRGVGVRFRGREREDVEEYCVSEKWVRVPAGKTVDRRGRPLCLKLTGSVEAYFYDAVPHQR